MKWRTKRGERFWATSTRASRVTFALAIFCTFSGLGVLLDVPRASHPPLWALAIYSVVFGVTAVGYAFAVLRDLRLMPFALVLQILLSSFTRWVTDPHRIKAIPEAAHHQRLVIDAVACFVMVLLGYNFFIRFIHRAARSHAELRTEVTLAQRIHALLVPVVSGRSARADYYGRSQASGAVAGDLVDVIEHQDGATFYVVDVSGHGVGAGVLMAMLRSAAHAALADAAPLPKLLGHLNRTLCELQRPGWFATCAVLRLGASGDAYYALAGHLPILRRISSTGAITELDVGGPPLGLREDQEYSAIAVEAMVGDAFLIVTDGLTEVFQRDGRDFGLEGIKGAILEGDGSPEVIAERIMVRATRFGKQLDDQSVLIVRIG